MDKEKLIENLLYLQQNAFEFHLTFNPGAGCYDSPSDFDDPSRGREWVDWVSEEQRRQAYETGRFIDGHVYPNGSVSFYQAAGTSLEDVVAEMAKCCRDDQAGWRSRGDEPLAPKTALYPGPKPADRYFQPNAGAECPHCKRIVGTFQGCAVGGCPCGEDM